MLELIPRSALFYYSVIMGTRGPMVSLAHVSETALFSCLLVDVFMATLTTRSLKGIEKLLVIFVLEV